MRFTIPQIAEVAHEANRALTRILGDVPVQPPWSDAPREMIDSSVKGVKFALDNPQATAAEQHDAWARDKLASGWKHGPVKDEAKKEHPALVAYDKLSIGTKAKDELFRAIVGALK